MYSGRLRPREKRQRVLISAQYEQRMEYMVQKLDELSQQVATLSNASFIPSGSHQSAIIEPPPVDERDPDTRPSTFVSQPQVKNDLKSCAVASKAEYEGGTSLSAHAIFATRYLQDVVSSTNSVQIAQEMTSILDTLHGIVDDQKQQRDTLENLYPYAKPIPQGSSIRQLPLPPVEMTLTCLRMAKEQPRIQRFWLIELLSVSQFNDYFLRVYSPGPATDADMIIVNGGLYWLFCECASLFVDSKVKENYMSQAMLCRDNLETVLSNLPFHMPVNTDVVFAMNVAATYCLQMAKPSIAWSFITTAAHLCQTLGLHSAHSLSTDNPETKNEKIRLFWAVFLMEKSLCLRLGRSSSFRDEDITAPRPSLGQSMNSLLVPRWIDLARIQGKTYSDIYSPSALMQSVDTRISRARSLVAEIKKLMDSEDEFERIYNNESRRAIGDDLHEIIQRSDRVCNLSLLSLIYRAIPPEKPSGTAFCDECIATAREALKEHEKCVALILSRPWDEDFLEMYINWTLLQFPFFPFIVLFCYIIETSEPDDLKCLGAFVEVLQSIRSTVTYKGSRNQVRLFRALYDVARKYVEVKASTPRVRMNVPSSNSMGVHIANPNAIGPSMLLQSSSMNSGQASSTNGALHSVSEAGLSNPWVNSGQQLLTQMPGYGSGVYAPALVQTDLNSTMAMDLTGMELGDWFHENHQMFRLLDDGHLW
ncbi:fungal-specific transcription factor domain-containing protein [Aspergillus pseudonomiae]|uniref:Fungal-specific transcription factor domain-containing protein n=1 Tax=Aspergillus pseudonomiae TaxID=1506151 RepID=A0A5N7D9B2_9EURO|nr:fungal-specific transcription factor domain-containing protein [Aspergillus pseudonomiae]KAE8403042.1 fungal-specific transcription factor domain-containing protein [Aspergillus pseudonomiae]